MGSLGVQLRCAAAGAIVLLGVTRCHASSPPVAVPVHRDAVEYVPRVQRYVVVVPPAAPASAGAAWMSAAAGPGNPQCAGWQAVRTSAPAYPWGWFGGRTSPQRSIYVRYYGEAVDYKLLREF